MNSGNSDEEKADVVVLVADISESDISHRPREKTTVGLKARRHAG